MDRGAKMFVYGVQYLRGKTPGMDQWEKDFKNMKKND